MLHQSVRFPVQKANSYFGLFFGSKHASGPVVPGVYFLTCLSPVRLSRDERKRKEKKRRGETKSRPQFVIGGMVSKLASFLEFSLITFFKKNCVSF